jgi:hypothetical protein
LTHEDLFPIDLKDMSERAVFAVDMPPSIVGAPLATATTHPQYAAAKAGDQAAALKLALDLVTPAMMESVRKLIGDKKPITVPVVSVEAAGRNKIPRAVAEVLASKLGAETALDLVQADCPKRTAMDGLDRLLNSPEFDGPVKNGADYLLVDDTLTQGGTFASLASHIRARGGNVVGAVALTGKQYSSTMSLSQDLLSQVRERFQDVESSFRAATGYGFDALTQSEARYLAHFKSADTARARIIAAGGSRSQRLDESSTSPGAGPGQRGRPS